MQIEEYCFSQEEIERLKTYRNNQSDFRLKRRFLSLLLIAEGVGVSVICSSFDISEHTLRLWFKNYLKKGIDALNSFQYQTKQSYLSESQQTQLKDWVKKKPQATVR